MPRRFQSGPRTASKYRYTSSVHVMGYRWFVIPTSEPCWRPCVEYSTKLASHSTAPSAVKLDPYPVLVKGHSSIIWLDFLKSFALSAACMALFNLGTEAWACLPAPTWTTSILFCDGFWGCGVCAIKIGAMASTLAKSIFRQHTPSLNARPDFQTRSMSEHVYWLGPDPVSEVTIWKNIPVFVLHGVRIEPTKSKRCAFELIWMLCYRSFFLGRCTFSQRALAALQCSHDRGFEWGQGLLPSARFSNPQWRYHTWLSNHLRKRLT